MKTILLTGGFNKTASESLYKIFKENVDCLDVFNTKENNYLMHYDQKKPISNNDVGYLNRNLGILHKNREATPSGRVSWWKITDTEYKVMNSRVQLKLEWYKDWLDDNNKELFVDLSIWNFTLSKETLVEFKKLLEPDYKIKILFSMRDPVERLLSEHQFREDRNKLNQKGYTPLTLTEYNQKLIERAEKHKTFYSDTISRYQSTFDEIFYLNTADFINHQHRRKELEEFIGQPISDYHPKVSNTSKKYFVRKKNLEQVKSILEKDIETYNNFMR